MPTYSYVCDACKSEFEREQRIIEDPIKKCPMCGKKKARRLITNGNFILKGGGWYADGYGLRKGASASAKNGNGSSSKTSASTDATSSSGSASSDSSTEKAKSSSESASAGA